ncbi:MAG: phosphoenolpyruvate--protein phosphotransferase [Pseudomonadota bacterium]
MAANAVRLRAPLTGILVPIERVPDPVFSKKLVGDGVSIDPISTTLLAPCDGRIVQLHRAHHALTIETPEGLEVMVHIGLDTVDLKGDGFSPLVEEGASVSAGDELIAFDADYVATHAKSLLTQVIVTNGERVASQAPATGSVTAGTDDCLVLELADVAEETGSGEGEFEQSEAIVVPNETGLHARPAAVLANLAKQFSAELRLRKGDTEANARSVVAIMGLNVVQHDEVRVLARGDDAAGAIERLTAELRAGLGDDVAPVPAGEAVIEAPEEPAVIASEDPGAIAGITASPGLAIGTVFQLRHEALDLPEVAAGSPADERGALGQAVEKATAQLQELEAELARRADEKKAAIFAAHRELLEDPELFEIAQSAIDAGQPAARGWQQAFSTCAERLEALGNPLLAERAGDLRDVGRRVLRELLGLSPEAIDYPDGAVLVAQDLTPSDTAGLDPARVRGFCTVAGGATSHVAILARSLNLPALAGVEARALDLADGTPVILDAAAGRMRIDPPEAEIDTVRERQARLEERRQADLAAAHEPAVTTDGTRIEVAANIGSADDARAAVEHGAEGVGLLRTEFLFLDRASAPDEDEQAGIYGEIAEVMTADRPVIVRTLDVGGDKPLAYLPVAPEENPFLGERGIRIGLTRPAILRAQLRAILRAAPRGCLRIMFPMIATLQEIREAKAILEEEREALDAPAVEVGIMIEVPSTAILADQFAREVDFFSVGTNDLTQYALAMDRGHPRLAAACDPLHPAVLRFINLAVQGGLKHDTWTGICGGVASDPQAVPILLGLGVTELSATVNAIPAVKAQVRAWSLADCKAVARKALAADSAAAVRALVPAEEEA